MSRATSSFLDRPLRSEGQARAELGGREQTGRERQRRLDEHGTSFCRTILDGAFERDYLSDGSYALRDNHATRNQTRTDDPLDDVAMSRSGAMRVGYAAALRELSCWIAAVAGEPAMDTATLTALNREITRLSLGLEASRLED